ncbi:MAG: agmatinase family protein [Chitinophagales bacterium]
MDASTQVDLFDHDLPDGWHQGIFTQKISAATKKRNTELRKKAAEHIHALEKGKKQDAENITEQVNKACTQLRTQIAKDAKAILADDKIPALVGGDHSTPLGLIDALTEKHGAIGILQIDAHADLRAAYEGFTYSHASIMYNAIQNEQVSRLVQVGIRDLCDDEMDIIRSSDRRIITHFNHELQEAKFRGIDWNSVCTQIISELPQKVYISFDIDGLDPKLCPHTGTPVPGGLSFDEAVYLLRAVAESGRQIVGFDLVEVTPAKDGWDAIVGARLLYKMCNLALKSNME